MAEPPEEETFSALWQRVQELEKALEKAPSDRRARALISECRVELARLEPKLGGPTQSRLRWIADRYPTTVVNDVIYVWAEATGQHELKASLWKDRERFPLTAEAALVRVLAYAKQTEHADVRSGRTRFDRYLPWLAREIGRAHKAAMKAAAAYVREFPSQTATKEQQEVAAKIRRARDYDDLWKLVSRPGGANKLAGPQSDAFSLAVGTYPQFVTDATEMFRTICDWARAEHVDIGRLDMEEAVRRVLPWAEERRRARPMPQGETIYLWPDGWSVQELTTTEQLVAEGDVMHHCVDEYLPSQLVAHGGNVRILSLRDPQGMPQATLEWTPSRGAFTQVRGVANVLLSDPGLLWRVVQLRHGLAALRGPWRPDAAVPSALTHVPGYEGRYRRELRGAPGWLVVDIVRGRVHDADEMWAHMQAAFGRVRDVEPEAFLSEYFPRSDADLERADLNMVRWTHFVTTGKVVADVEKADDELIYAVWLATKRMPGMPLVHLAKLKPPPPDGAAPERAEIESTG